MVKPAAAAGQYLQTQAQASTPLELVVMLYDGAIRFASAAKDAIERNDIPARRIAMSRLLGIIAELQNTLDMERGGQIALDLDSLYSWMTTRLLDAAVAKDARPIDEVRRALEPLRDAWQTIAAAPPPGTRP